MMGRSPYPLGDARVVRRPGIHQASVMINSIAPISGKQPQPIMPPANGIPRFTRSRLRRQVPAIISRAKHLYPIWPHGYNFISMKTLAIMILIFSLTSLAVAQNVEIIGLDHSGLISWSTTNTPIYCGVEAKWNLHHTWLPIQEWNLLMTSPVTNTTVDINSLMDQISALIRTLTGDDLHGIYFRIVASSSPLGPTYATNLIRVINTSTSVLANVEIGLIENWSHNPITNLTSLVQGETSPVIPVVQEIALPTSSVISVVVPTVGISVQDGFYLSYDHNGSNRMFESTVVPFGDPEKNIRVAVSNASLTVTFEWFGFSGTRQY